MKAALLTLLLVLTPWSGQALREEPASLEGFVVEHGTGQPIARARALLAKGGNLDPREALEATTDSSGKFTIRDIPPGVYRLYVGHSAYVPAEYGQSAPERQGALIVLTAGEVMRVDMRLAPSASVQGRVVNQSGAPLPNFVVKVFRARYERGDRVFEGGEYAVTEENGEFRLFGLAPGWYFLTAVPSQDQGALPLNTDVVDWPAYYGGATEDESRPIRLEPGRVFDAGALVAPRGPAARVRGLVVNAATGKPEPDARILLGRQRRRGVESSGMSTSFKNGFFELAGAAPGDYVIDAVTPTLAGSAMFQARGSDVESVRVLLHPRVRVSGRVRLDSTTQGMFGAGFGRMRVVLDAGRALIDASIDSRGAFTLANAPVGDYRLALSGAPPNVFIRTARLGGADIMEKGLHVDGKSNPSVEITLGAASSVLGVIALDAARKPAPGAVVALIPENRRQLDRYRKAVTDKSGDARLENVAPGTYRLYAWESIEENAWIDPDILDAYEKNGETVTIPETGLSIVTVTVNPL